MEPIHEIFIRGINQHRNSRFNLRCEI